MTGKETRPREKLYRDGVAALSDTELLAAMLGSGVQGKGVTPLAVEIGEILDRRNGTLSPEDLAKVKGIGQAKACMLMACLEFARRRIRPEGVKIRQAADLLPLVQHLADRKQEYFTATTLNGAHEVIKTRVITIGLVNATQVHPREVFSDALKDRACAIIVAHNHPSGDLTPSASDFEVTRQLKASGDLLGVRLLDHIIFSQRGFYSFQERGKLGLS